MKADKDKILEAVIKNLLESTEKKWVQGYIEDWRDYAKAMSQSINNNIEVLKTLIENE